MPRPGPPPDLDKVIDAIIKPSGMRRAGAAIKAAKQASYALKRLSGGLSSRLMERARFTDTAAFMLSDREVSWFALMPRELRMLIVTLLYWDLRTCLCPALIESEVEMSRACQTFFSAPENRDFLKIPLDK